MATSQRASLEGDNESGGPRVSLQTGLSLALVVLLIAGGVTYGRQSERLDSIVIELSETRSELREMRSEVRSLRELLIARTPPTKP